MIRMSENKNKKVKIVLAVIAGLAVMVLVAFFWGKQWFASSYFNQGQTAFLKGDYDAAGQLFEKSLKFNAKNPEPHFYLGKIALGKTVSSGPLLYPNADYESAVEHFEQSFSFGLVQKNKDAYLVSLNDAGFSYYMLKQYEKSIPLFLKYIELNPTGAFTARYFVATDYLNRSNKPEEALDILLPAVDAVSVNSPINRRNLFRVYSLLGRLYSYFADAVNTEKYARLSIESGVAGNREPEIQVAHVLLSIVYGSRGDFSSAMAEIKAANELAGSDRAYNCSLATAYFAGKNYFDAVEAAKAVKPSNSYGYSTCLQILGESYLAEGNKIEAKKYMEDYLTMTDKFKDKNIFVFRNREKFVDELENLK